MANPAGLMMFLILAAAALPGLAAPPPQSGLPRAALRIGTNTLSAQVAADGRSREVGLMSRSALGRDEAMVFVFPHPQGVAFWMKDTPVPLSVAYLGASGRILEMHDLNPRDETPVPSASGAVVYALEVARGWFGEHGILPGDSVSGLPSPDLAR